MENSFRKITALLLTLCMIAGMTVLPRAAYAEGLDDAAIVAADKESLAIGFSVSDSVYGVTDDLTLPLTGASGSAITWLSDTPEVIAHDGAVTRPAADAGDAEVTLTATITYGGVSDSKEFALTVEAASALMIGPLAAMVGIQAGLPEIKSGHNNNAANTTQISFGGAVWYVIGYNGSGVESSSGTMTLLHNAGGGWYSIFGANSAYSGSTLQNTMNNAYNGLPIKEQNMVMAHSLVGISGDPVTDAKFWPLSSDEANLITADVRKYFTNWWLRTPGSESTAHLVHGDGSAPFPAYTVENGNTCARPAFILNTESILFTSPREGASAKDSVSVGDGLVGAAAPSGTLKFTAQDSDLDNLNLTSASLNQITVKSGENVTVTFAGAKTGLGKYVSCVIVDSNDKVTHYGKLSGEASGTANFTVPALADGNYKMKLFNEQVSEPLYEVNRDAYIDFCSTPIEITMAVDNTAPALTAGTVNRTSDTAATVTFNSDEAGTYYYQLNTAPADAAALANAGTNQTAMTAGEQTIPLTGITAGVHTIYVAAKDALGNVSSLLTLNIPACKYTVTYNANGGTVANPTTEVTYDSADALLVPTRAGYTFGGWYDGADGTGNQVTSAAGAPTGTVAGYVNSGKWSLTEGKTVHAKWTACKYTVTYNANGGTVANPTTEVTYDSADALLVPTRAGYTFGGWYDGADGTGNQVTSAAGAPTGTVAGYVNSGKWSLTEGKTVHAKWTANQYTVTFSVYGGTAVPAVTQDYDTQIAAAPVSTKTGHTLAGWYSDAELTTVATFPYTITGDSTLYAKWTVNQYTVTFNANGGSEVPPVTQDYDTQIAAAPAPTKEGHTLAGWYSDAELTMVATFPYTITGDSTLYAKWTVNQYTVTFNANGGTAVPSVTQDYDTQIAAAPASTKTGHTLAGWYSDAELTTVATFPYTITGDSTLYAKWTVNQYTVTFNANDGTAVPAVTQDYDTQIATAPASTKTGHSHAGWYTDAGLNTAATFPYTITENSTLYAKWTANEYTITVQNDGNGTASANTASAAQDTEITLTATPKEGYQFKEWQVISGGITISNNKFTMPAAGVTIKAIFAVKSSGGNGGGSAPSGILVPPIGKDIADSGVSLSFPAGAVEGDIRVQVKEAALTTGMELPDDSKLLSKVVDIVKNRSGNFAQPVTITMSFNKSQVDPEKYDIKICCFDEQSGEWVELGNIKVDLDGSAVSGQVDHFTKFAVIATRTPAPQPEIKLPADIANHWGKDSIVKLMQAGVIVGYPDGSFQPEKSVSRAEFTVMLVKALKLESKQGGLSFKDTAAHWAKDSINAAAAHGIISGYDQNSFGPDDQIIREQAAIIIARATKLQAGDQALSFSDAQQISPWALSGVAAAVGKSYLSGYPDNSFRPQGYTSRAEAAAIIAKLL